MSDTTHDFSFKRLFVPLTTTKAIHFIIIIGLVVFSNVFLNGFIGDDTGYINHPYIQQNQVIKLLAGSSTDLGGTAPVTGQFYRPVMLIIFAQLYSLFGDAAFPYHFFQLLLHIANASLVFLLFQKYIHKPIALGISLLFLIHPIQTETVAYVSNLQDVLFVFFGLLAVHITLHTNHLSPKRYVLLSTLLLLTLLSKETGIIFFFIIAAHIVLTKKYHTLKTLALYFCGTISIYALIRFGIASVGIGHTPASLLSDLPLYERIRMIPTVLWYYIRTFLYPQDISLGQTWVVTGTNIPSLVTPFILIAAFIILLGLCTGYIYKSHKQYYVPFLFFVCWFGMGMLPHLQILPLEMTVATRWFYLPAIGLLGLVGLLLEISLKKKKSIVYILLSAALLFCSWQTFHRLYDWRDALTLYAHDAKQTDSYMLEHALGFELLQRNRLEDAKVHFERSISLYPNPINTSSLGVYYHRKKNISESKKWFYRSNQLGDYFLAYQNLSRIVLTHDDPTVAMNYIKKAVKKFPQSNTLWYLLAIAYYKQNHLTDALDAARQAYLLSPNQQNAYILHQLENNLPIKIN